MDLVTINDENSAFPFLQMPRFIWEMKDLSINAKAIYMLVFDRIRQGAGNGSFKDADGNWFCYFNDDELSEKLGLKRRATINAVNELKVKKLLFRERTKKRDGRSITYLNVPLASASECTTSVSLCTEMHNLSAPECTTKAHQNAQPFPYINKNNISNNNYQENKEKIHKKEIEKEKSSVRVPEPSKPKKSKKDQVAEDTTQAVIDHWNTAYGTKYSTKTKGTIKLIASLLDSGYSQEEILQVIDYRAKSRKTKADYKWFVPATVLALKNFDRSYQFMLNDQTKPHQGYKNRNNIPDSVTLPDWYQIKESEQASRDDVQKILELQNQILKGEQQ